MLDLVGGYSGRSCGGVVGEGGIVLLGRQVVSFLARVHAFRRVL